jgi:hypothetical protein
MRLADPGSGLLLLRLKYLAVLKVRACTSLRPPMLSVVMPVAGYTRWSGPARMAWNQGLRYRPVHRCQAPFVAGQSDRFLERLADARHRCPDLRPDLPARSGSSAAAVVS